MAAARFKDNIAPVIYGYGSGKIGVYYNYCATSAGTYCWGDDTSYTGSPESDPNTSSYRDIDADICPAGWRLPTSSAGTTRITDYGTLYAAYTNRTATNPNSFQYNLSTPFSGSHYPSSQDGLGSYGLFWSSTWAEIYDMFGLYAYSTGASTSNYRFRSHGGSIRCVLGSS